MSGFVSGWKVPVEVGAFCQRLVCDVDGGIRLGVAGVRTRRVRGMDVVMMGRRSEKIKGRKEKQDRQKVKVYSRIGKLITSAVKAGGADPTTNKTLQDALDLAKDGNVPKDNIERAISRASSKDQADYKESTFEVYGHGGVGIIIDVLTDNNNRASAEIRTVVNKHNMKIASPGSVGFNFDRKGVIRVPVDQIKDLDEFFLEVAETGAEDVEEEGEMCVVYTDVPSFHIVRKAITGSGYKVDSSTLEMVPKTKVECAEEEMERNITAIELLEEIDDVDAVFYNMDD